MDHPPAVAAAQVAYSSRHVGRLRRKLRRQGVLIMLRLHAIGPLLRRGLDVAVTGLGLVCLIPLLALVALACLLYTSDAADD